MNARRSLVSFAVVAMLFGRVLDVTTGQGLAHVAVSVGNIRTTSDASGRYRLPGLRAGRATVTLESADVPVQRVDVHIGAGSTHRDLHACSTTLDYHCDGPANSGGSASGAG